MKQTILLSLLSLCFASALGQTNINTTDYSQTRTGAIVTIPIGSEQYHYLQTFRPAQGTVQLTNFPTGAKFLANPTQYTATRSGTDLTVTFPAQKFRRSYWHRQPLFTVGVEATDGTKRLIQYVRGGGTAGQAASTPGAVGNAIVTLDMCPDAVEPLQISANNTFRKWLYIKNKESVTFRAKNANPNSYSIAVNGDFHNLLAESGGEAIISQFLTQTTAASNPGGSGLTPQTMADFRAEPAALKQEIRAIIGDIKLLRDQFNALKALLGRRLSAACLPDAFTPDRFVVEMKSSLGGQVYADTKQQLTNELNKLQTLLGPTGLAAADSDYQDFSYQLKSFKETFTDTYFKEIADRIDKINLALQNKFVSSLPIVVNGRNNDVVRFTVEQQYISPATKKSATYDVFIIGGIKIDISAGLFVNWLVDHTYVGREVTSSGTSTSVTSSSAPSSTSVTSSTTTSATRYLPIQEETNQVSFAPGALIHAYPRLNIAQGNVNVGVSAGLSTGSRVSYYAGFSLLLGRQQRIVITGGWAWGKVQRLSKLYATSEKDAQGNEKGFAVTGGQFATQDIIDRKGFIGFTYNLGSNKPKAANE